MTRLPSSWDVESPVRDEILAMVVDDLTQDDRVDAAAAPPTQV